MLPQTQVHFSMRKPFPFFNSDQYLINNPWKIHEEFGLLIEDMVQNSRNEAHPR